MSHVDISIRTYFQKLGLEQEIADIYLALHTYGPQTISQLARNSRVERTRIYRLIDTLLSSNLIEVEADHKRGIIKAAPIANLNILISQREQELKSLQDELGLIEQVLARNSLSSPATHVQFYRGIEGTKQMFWNQTKAKTDVLCMLVENMYVTTNTLFLERWIERCNDQQLQFRSIVGDVFLKSQQTWLAKRKSDGLKSWDQRYAPPKTFNIPSSMVLYDNVTSYHNWKDGEVFGIEIYNADIAIMQRQFFEMLWQKVDPTIQ